MASQRKIKVQKFRKSRKEKKKQQLREKLREQAEAKRKASAFRKEIKQTLGFDSLLKNLKIPKPEPRQPILDWNGVEWCRMVAYDEGIQ
jgi:hypothetical protein